MLLFEVYIATGGLQQPLLSDEIKESTGAQIMTPQEAAFVGLEGIPEDPEGRERLLVACSPASERLIASRLEAHNGVSGFRMIALS